MDVHSQGAGNGDEFPQAILVVHQGHYLLSRQMEVRNISGKWFGLYFKVEGRARSLLALRPDLAFHQLYKPSAYGKAQARAAVFSGGGCVDLAEGLEEFVHILWRDSYSRIRYGEVDLARFICQLHTNRYMATFCKFNGIAEKLSVNLTALLRRLARTWRSREESPRMVRGTSSSTT